MRGPHTGDVAYPQPVGRTCYWWRIGSFVADSGEFVREGPTNSQYVGVVIPRVIGLGFGGGYENLNRVVGLICVERPSRFCDCGFVPAVWSFPLFAPHLDFAITYRVASLSRV